MNEAPNQSATNADRALQWASQAMKEPAMIQPEVWKENAYYQARLDEVIFVIQQQRDRLTKELAEEREKWSKRFTAPVVCICGSTKFKQTWIAENARLTRIGNIVLAVGLFGHHEQVYPSPEEKLRLDDTHKCKIDLCDWVWVLDVNGYIGESTRSEIEYAERLGKPVRFLSREFPAYTEPKDGMAEQLAAAQSALTEKEKELDRRAGLLMDRRTEINVLQGELSTERAAREETAKDRDKLYDALECTVAQRDALRAQLQQAQNSLSAECALHRQQYDNLHSQLQKAEEDAKAARESSDVWQVKLITTVQQAKKTCGDLRGKLQQAEQERDEAREEIRVRGSANDSLRAELGEVESILNDTRDHEVPAVTRSGLLAKTLRAELAATRETVRRVELERDEANQSTNALSNLIANISDTLRSRGFGPSVGPSVPGKALDERVIALAKDRDALQKQNAALQEFRDECERQFQLKTDECIALEARNAELVKALTNLEQLKLRSNPKC